MERNERFVSALDYLYRGGLVADQRELSRKTGIAETSLSRIINNKVREPSEATIRKLNTAFGNIFNPAFFRCESSQMILEDAPGASDGSAERDATIEALEELVDTQRVLIEALRERLRSLGVEYIATVKPMRSRAYDTPAPTPFIAPAAEPSNQSSEPSAPARIKQETSPNVSPKRKRKRDN